MEIFVVVVYLIAIIFASGGVIFIRDSVKKGTGITRVVLNIVALLWVSIIFCFLYEMNPLNLIWMFLLSWILGFLSKIPPFSLLNLLGTLIFGLSTIGLDNQG
ncbi:MAG TPA: hypothetical protein PLB16_07995 [bacterium]|jgi:hypothetical protein|nr:hypothetical protein [bacterium]HQN73341.1 hypothetical protein [bacterium]